MYVACYAAVTASIGILFMVRFRVRLGFRVRLRLGLGRVGLFGIASTAGHRQ